MRGEKRAQGLVVPADEMVPSVIADGVDEVGRPDDVGEHHGPNDALGGLLDFLAEETLGDREVTLCAEF